MSRSPVARDPMKRRLCLMYTMDPRGQKVGGIGRISGSSSSIIRPIFPFCSSASTRSAIARSARSCRWRSVGGGSISCPSRMCRRAVINRRPGGSRKSHTLALCRRRAATSLGRCGAAVGEGPASADLHRFEFALVARLLGRPRSARWCMARAPKGDRMDSLIKRYWFIHRANEEMALRLADRVFAVNPNILRRYEARDAGDRREGGSDHGLGRRRIVPLRRRSTRVTGLQDFVRGPARRVRGFALMFAHDRAPEGAARPARSSCNYVGATDPFRYPEFAEIADVTVRHGFQAPKASRASPPHAMPAS